MDDDKKKIVVWTRVIATRATLFPLACLLASKYYEKIIYQEFCVPRKKKYIRRLSIRLYKKVYVLPWGEVKYTNKKSAC